VPPSQVAMWGDLAATDEPWCTDVTRCRTIATSDEWMALGKVPASAALVAEQGCARCTARLLIRIVPFYVQVWTVSTSYGGAAELRQGGSTAPVAFEDRFQELCVSDSGSEHIHIVPGYAPATREFKYMTEYQFLFSLERC